MFRSNIKRYMLVILFVATALSLCVGQLNAKGWSRGHFLDVENRSQYSYTLYLQLDDGSIQRVKDMYSKTSYRFYGLFTEPGVQRVVITDKAGEYQAIRISTQIGHLKTDKFMSGRRIVLTDESFEDNKSPQMEKVMALDGQWVVVSVGSGAIATLQLTQPYGSDSLSGTITEKKTGKKYPVTGKASDGGYTIFFYDNEEGTNELVCTVTLKPDRLKRAIFRGDAMLQWIDEESGEVARLQVPIYVVLSWMTDRIYFKRDGGEE